MKTDFTIRQAQQSDAVALKELFQNTVLVINRRDYSQAEVEDWASCGNNLSNIKERIETHCFVVTVINSHKSLVFHLLRLKAIYILCLSTRIFKVKVLLRCFWKK